MNKLLSLVLFCLLFTQLATSSVAYSLRKEEVLHTYNQKGMTHALPKYTCEPVEVPVVTNFITTKEVTAHENTTILLSGSLCGQFEGMAVRVTMMLKTNPDWNPTFGVIRYSVLDSENGTSVLCTNTVKGKVVPYCLVPTWTKSNEIYIRAKAGEVEAISFSLDAEFHTKGSDEAAYIRKQSFIQQSAALNTTVHYPSALSDVVDLTPIITLSDTQKLGYRETALLNFTFCSVPPTDQKVRVTVMEADGLSSYALYLCKDLPCKVDGANVVAYNGQELPVNAVNVPPGQWSTLYALVVCWAGAPAENTFEGKFNFEVQWL